MGSSLKIENSNGKVELSGILDENSDLKALEGISGKAIFSFANVTRVNSCGVREWVNLLKKIKASELVTELIYDDCPMVVIKQVNAVPDFCGKAKVRSFFAPYYCEACDQDQTLLVQSADVKAEKPPEMKCSSCKGSMVFDAIPNQYFSFLKRK